MSQPSDPTRQWPDYRAVWRWHFYASLYCLPFVVILSLTGMIYLFKSEVEAWIDGPLDSLTADFKPLPVQDQVLAALTSIPGSTPVHYEIPATPQSAARVLVRSPNGESQRIAVHPGTGDILDSVPDRDRLMRVMFRLHGELMLGDWGSHLVETAASWTILMILTGLFLWWPRGQTTWGGILYPRFGRGGRALWRDLHSVTGFWICSLALFLLISGLPWSKFWGGYFKSVRQLGQSAPIQQDWSTTGERTQGRRSPSAGDHSGHDSGTRSRRTPMPDLTAFDRVVATAIPLGLDHPVTVAPPGRDKGSWTVKSMTANRPRRVTVTVDGASGAIKSREDFQDRPWLDRIVGYGIAAHEGRLFGWPNQLLGLITALGLLALSGSGIMMWWRRRDPGLGAPRMLIAPRFSLALLLGTLALAVALPLFGATLLFTLLLEALILRRIPAVRNWLGLTRPAVLNPEIRPGIADSGLAP